MPKLNKLFVSMSLREIVGLFCLPVKKPPDKDVKSNDKNHLRS